jgi:hypothetical protein
VPGAAGQRVRGDSLAARPVPNHGIAGNMDAGLQKVRCGSGPLRPVGHDLADNGRHGIVVDDILDRGAPVGFEWPAPRLIDRNGRPPSRFTLTKIMGRLGGSRQMDLRSSPAMLASNQDGKTWQLGSFQLSPRHQLA